jgi:polyhydroxyalkanoate synthesis regulator phasin
MVKFIIRIQASIRRYLALREFKRMRLRKDKMDISRKKLVYSFIKRGVINTEKGQKFEKYFIVQLYKVTAEVEEKDKLNASKSTLKEGYDLVATQCQKMNVMDKKTAHYDHLRLPHNNIALLKYYLDQATVIEVHPESFNMQKLSLLRCKIHLFSEFTINTIEELEPSMLVE